MRTFMNILLTESALILKYFFSKTGFGCKKTEPQISPAKFWFPKQVLALKNWATLLGGFKNMQFLGFSPNRPIMERRKNTGIFLGIIPK